MSDAKRSLREGGIGSLGDCLVDGDAERFGRAQRSRRKALALSLGVQLSILAVLILAPIFATGQRIILTGYTPIPPFPGYRNGASRAAPAGESKNHLHNFADRFPILSPLLPVSSSKPGSGGPKDFTSTIGDLPPGGSSNDPGLPPIGGFDPRRPAPPPMPATPAHTQKRISIAQIEPAMLTHRVEPVYPALALQTHREGKVELRAIIATDGSVMSLEVLRADPLFVQSALAAVQQWRYRPTILNGQSVEVETRITVIYTMRY